MGLASVGLSGLSVPVQPLPLTIRRGPQAGDQRLVALLQGDWRPHRCSTATAVPTGPQVPPQA